MEYLEALNNREIAIIFWSFVVSIFLLKSQVTRRALLSLFKSFLSKQLVITWLLMFSYISLLLTILMHFSLWDFSLLKEATYWSLGTAFIFLVNGVGSKDKNYIKKVLTESLKLLVILEFVINFYTFNLFIELAIVPVLVVITAMGAFIENKKEYQPIKKIIDWALVFFGIGIIIFSLTKVVTKYSDLITLDNLRALVLPSLLTLLYIPFLYFFMLYATYENIFFRINSLMRENPDLGKYTKMKTLLINHLNLRKLQAFSSYSASKLVGVNSKEDVSRMIPGFKNI